MDKVLRHAAVAAAAAALAGAALADDSGSDRNRFQFEIDASYVHADSPLGAWTDGGLGKLRYAETNDGLESTRVFGQYRGRIANTLSATVIADYQSDASSGIDVTEAYMDWRPIPKSENQQQIRFGAFYPPLSLENVDLGWQSPFTYSYSAINTWLGEEVRPIGVEWSLHRRLGFAGSPHDCARSRRPSTATTPRARCSSGAAGRCTTARRDSATRCRCRPRPIFDFTGSVVGHAAQSVRSDRRDRSPPGRLCGRRVELRAPCAGPARTLRQPCRPVRLFGRPMGLGHVVQSARSPGGLAVGPRARRSVAARRYDLGSRRSRRRHALPVRRRSFATTSTRNS